jgi:hypothetical protein
MAYPVHRSCVRDLHAGMTDGAYKKAAPNRGGVVEDTTFHVRRQMSGVWHGFNDIQMKVLPDGRTDHPPYYTDVRAQDMENV